MYMYIFCSIFALVLFEDEFDYYFEKIDKVKKFFRNIFSRGN